MNLSPIHRDAALEFGLTYEIKSSFGTEMSAMWNSPEMSELMTSHLERRRAAQGAFTMDQTSRLAALEGDMLARQNEISSRMQVAQTEQEKETLWLEFKSATQEQQSKMDQLFDESIGEGRLIDEEQLRQMYGNLIEVTRPMTPEEAELLYTENLKEEVRKHIFSRSKGGIGTAAAKFGVALLGAATDPAELAIGFLSTMVVPWTGGTLGRRALIAGGEAFLGSVLTEPAYYALSKRQQLDYTMNEALLNIGVGTLLGAGIGAAFGPRGTGSEGMLGTSRIRKDPEMVLTSREAEMGGVALNQYVNDELVNLSPFMRDLRGSTSLTSFRGVQFQPSYTADLSLPLTRAPLTTSVIGPDGTPFRYKTVQQADTVAAQVGGTVSRTPDGFYNVRQPIEGDFVRDPVGQPITFKTERAANKFIDAAQEGLLPADARAVNLSQPGRPSFGIAGGIVPERVAEIESGKANLEIPQGVNTREIEIIPDPEDAIGNAVRSTMTRKGNAAYEDLARDFARTAPENAEPTAIDVGVSDDVAILTEEVEFYRELLGENATDLDEIKDIDAVATGKINAYGAAIKCMVGGNK